MPWWEDKGDHLIVNIRVVPRASKDEIQGILGDSLKVRIQSPPIDGKANAHLVKWLARRWNLSRSDIKILSGETGRNKRIRIAHPTDELRKELLSINPC